MGFDPVSVALVVSAVATVASVGMTYEAGQAQQKAASQAASDREAALKQQKEANDVATAEQKAKQIAAERDALREARVRRARINQSATNTGVMDSSGQIGSEGIIGTNVGTVISGAQSSNLAIQGINTANNAAATYATAANNDITTGNASAALWNSFANIASGVSDLTSNKSFMSLLNSPTDTNKPITYKG